MTVSRRHFFIWLVSLDSSGVKFFQGSPDLVVEVLFPSSIRTDRYVKFNAYEQAAIPEYWIINPNLRSVEVFTLSGGEYAQLGEFAADKMLKSNKLHTCLPQKQDCWRTGVLRKYVCSQLNFLTFIVILFGRKM